MKKLKSNLLKIMMGVLGLGVFTSCYGTPRPMDYEDPEQDAAQVEEVVDTQEAAPAQEEVSLEEAK